MSAENNKYSVDTFAKKSGLFFVLPYLLSGNDVQGGLHNLIVHLQ